MITLWIMPLPAVDASTLNGLLLAITAIVSTANICLQQWNARQGKARGEKADKNAQEAAFSAQAAVTVAVANAKQLAEHSHLVADKLDTVVKQTNGINEALSSTVQKQAETIQKLGENK